MITEGQGKELLALARQAIFERVQKMESRSIPKRDAAADAFGSGVFVTVRVKGKLRGCLGYVGEDRVPLCDIVRDRAAAAATRDERFLPVQPDELPDLHLEVSILSPLELLTDIQNLEVGRHGAIISLAARRGLLLPQVASERGWDRTAFLENLCAKARLPRDSWKQAKIHTFTTKKFGDADEVP